MRTVDVIRALARLMGGYVFLAGVCQTAVSVFVVFLGAVGKYDFVVTLGTQLFVYGCGWLLLGPVLLVTSGPLARFAAKHARDSA